MSKMLIMDETKLDSASEKKRKDIEVKKNKIREMYLKKKSIDEIATTVKCSKSMIRKTLSKLKDFQNSKKKPRILALRNEGMTASEIAKKMGMKEKNVIERLIVYKVRFKTKKSTKVNKVFADDEDILLTAAVNAELNDEQKTLLEVHRNKPRSQIAKLLKIDKLTLNFILHKECFE